MSNKEIDPLVTFPLEVRRVYQAARHQHYEHHSAPVQGQPYLTPVNPEDHFVDSHTIYENDAVELGPEWPFKGTLLKAVELELLND